MNRMWSLTLTDWKSFGTSRNVLKLAPLTLLVGPNGSGKSNALDALRFLQGAALDFPLSDVLRGRYEGQREIWPPIRGQMVEAARIGCKSFTLATTWGDYSEHELHELEVRAADATVVGERLGRRGQFAFDTHSASLGGTAGRAPGGAIKVALASTGTRGRSASQVHSASRSLMGQVEQQERVNKREFAVVRHVQRSLRNMLFLDIQPARMRDYQPEHAQSLGSSGENISPILAALEPARLNDVLDWLAELCAPRLEGFEFEKTQLKDVMFFLKEDGGARVSARSISDGTLRFLGLITALLTADEETVLVLEEPDVGLHPARIHLLAELLEQVTRERAIQVIATTHSPTLLRHLSPSALGNVVALGRSEESTTVCSRLGDLPDFDALKASPRLDQLVSTGWIERAL